MSKFPPRKFYIDGDWWTVKMFDKVENVDKHGSEDCAGQCDFRNMEIRLYSGLPPGQMLKTVIHEVLHALSDARNITCLKKDKYHYDLDQIAVGIANFLIENKLYKGE